MERKYKKMNVVFRKCKICGNVVLSRNSLKCCNEDMIELKANSTDASFEKHIPSYEINDNKITIKVNHVMEEKHYIKWIMMVTQDEVFYKELSIGEEAIAEFEYKGKCDIYSYCNLHDLWTIKVE